MQVASVAEGFMDIGYATTRCQSSEKRWIREGEIGNERTVRIKQHGGRRVGTWQPAAAAQPFGSDFRIRRRRREGGKEGRGGEKLEARSMLGDGQRDGRGRGVVVKSSSLHPGGRRRTSNDALFAGAYCRFCTPWFVV